MVDTPVLAFEVSVSYQEPALRVVMKGVSNHLLRTVLLGFWATLDDDDRTDFIAELAHYDCGSLDEIPPLSQLIVTAHRTSAP